ncbi:hypothetical protein Ancab_001914, partial [Ancistrocladus abbreviatus]
MEWLKGSFTGFLKFPCPLVTLREGMQKEGISDCEVRSIKRKIVLLTATRIAKMDQIVTKKGNALAKWFGKLHPWSKHDSGISREVWLRCAGIPLHAWNEEFFITLARRWGKLIDIDRECGNFGLSLKEIYAFLSQLGVVEERKVEETVQWIVEMEKRDAMLFSREVQPKRVDKDEALLESSIESSEVTTVIQQFSPLRNNDAGVGVQQKAFPRSSSNWRAKGYVEERWRMKRKVFCECDQRGFVSSPVSSCESSGARLPLLFFW